MHPGSPSAMSNFIFPPPDHSLNPTPSHRAGQSCPSPAPPRWGLPDRPTYTHQLPGRWHSVCHPFPPSRPREMKGGGGAHQLPASGTGIPPTRPAPSHQGGQPKGITPPSFPTLSGRGRASLPPPPAPGGSAAVSQGEGLWVTGCSHQPCHPARRVEKVQSKAFSVPAGQPAVPLSIAPPKSKGPGLPGGRWGVFRVENEGCAIRQQRGLRITAAQQSLCKGL